MAVIIIPETCPRRIVGESARTRCVTFEASSIFGRSVGRFRLFRALFRPWENLLWEKRERKNDALTSFDVSVLDKFVGLFTCVSLTVDDVSMYRLDFFVESTDYFTLGGWRNRFVAGSKNVYACRETQCSFFVSIILMAVKRTKLFESEIRGSMKMIRK